jgi:heme-degrading monooxygenase HmoA
VGVVLINPFEVPAGRDDEFVEQWGRSREFLGKQDGFVDTALHRSLAPDAEFRFVNVANWQSPQAFQAAMTRPDFPGRQMPFTGHPALYEVVTEDPAPDGTDARPVLINLFEVPPEADDDFVANWERARDAMRPRPGYVGTRLHRSLSPEATYRFVNIAPWESPQAFQAAIRDPGFQEATSAILHRAHPSLYQVVRR